MKALTLSCLLAAAPAASGAPLYYDCGLRKIDLACRRVDPPSWQVTPLDARHADKAYVMKFGGPGREAGEPDWAVSFGNAARQALFWAAVLTTFIL